MVIHKSKVVTHTLSLERVANARDDLSQIVVERARQHVDQLSEQREAALARFGVLVLEQLRDGLHNRVDFALEQHHSAVFLAVRLVAQRRVLFRLDDQRSCLLQYCYVHAEYVALDCFLAL